eukprot:IDg18478t1
MAGGQPMVMGGACTKALPCAAADMDTAKQRLHCTKNSHVNSCVGKACLGLDRTTR